MIGSTRSGESGDAVAMPRNPAIHAWAEPAERDGAEQPAQPLEPRQLAQDSYPAVVADVPGTVGGAHVHFFVEPLARERGARSDQRIIVVHEAQPLGLVERLDPSLHCPAERAGTVHKNFEFCLFGHFKQLDDNTLQRERFSAPCGNARIINRMPSQPRTAVEQLEHEFAAWLGTAGAVATGFGRGALWLALEAAGVRGGEVAVPDFVCAQVPEAVQRAGASPVFYRVGRDLAVIAESFEAALSKDTRAAILVHYFGRVQECVQSLAEICRKRGVPLIEDCALAMGAGTSDRRAGKFGDLAIFSFTKSDWCFGGGMVISNSPEMLVRLREIRAREFRVARKLPGFYGLLRRADFAANLPSRSRAASIVGRSVQLLSGMGGGNFYDAGRLDALLPDFAARRAQHILSHLDGVTAKRREIQRRLILPLGSAAWARLHWPEPQPSETAAFVPIVVADGNAVEAVEQADRRGVTLRLAWPAYQQSQEGQGSENLEWLADHLLILEVHPDLTAREVEKISNALKSLAARS